MPQRFGARATDASGDQRTITFCEARRLVVNDGISWQALWTVSKVEQTILLVVSRHQIIIIYFTSSSRHRLLAEPLAPHQHTRSSLHSQHMATGMMAPIAPEDRLSQRGRARIQATIPEDGDEAQGSTSMAVAGASGSSTAAKDRNGVPFDINAAYARALHDQEVRLAGCSAWLFGNRC